MKSSPPESYIREKSFTDFISSRIRTLKKTQHFCEKSKILKIFRFLVTFIVEKKIFDIFFKSILIKFIPSFRLRPSPARFNFPKKKLQQFQFPSILQISRKLALFRKIQNFSNFRWHFSRTKYIFYNFFKSQSYFILSQLSFTTLSAKIRFWRKKLPWVHFLEISVNDKKSALFRKISKIENFQICNDIFHGQKIFSIIF